jgi:hypothetical protein
VSLLEESGFKVSLNLKSFPIRVVKDQWLQMIGPSPLFSNISSLSTEQRDEDVIEISTLYKELEELSFADHQLFIVAEK